MWHCLTNKRNICRIRMHPGFLLLAPTELRDIWNLQMLVSVQMKVPRKERRTAWYPLRYTMHTKNLSSTRKANNVSKRPTSLLGNSIQMQNKSTNSPRTLLFLLFRFPRSCFLFFFLFFILSK